MNKLTDYKQLLANLKVTFKFVGVVWIAISASILIGCVSDGDYSNIYDPMYFLSFAPFIVIATLAYTNLKNSHINKFICSILFAGIGALLMNLFYFLGNFIEVEEINIRFILYMSSIVFGVLSMLYLQLPWKDENA
ncbi:MAG: hypothetical protein ABJH06_01735 [Paraglaciecola sp.]|uniref:hypothetical protein n=1 Tax=Paraglaciecola sp. TaxID=1920173 RepID=UPI003298154C